MKEESPKEVITRREKTVKYVKVNCAISCLVLILNIVFVVGTVLYVLNVRASAAAEISLLKEEINSMRLSVDKNTRLVFNSLSPTRELIRRQLDTTFDETDDE